MKATDKQRYIKYLNDIHGAMTFLLQYENSSLNNIDKKDQLAIERSFEIIGEATKRLTFASFVNKYPDVEWSGMAKIRDFVIHHYDDTEINILLIAIQTSIKKNIILIEKILEIENATK